MALYFFTIPALDNAQAQQDLRVFCRQNTVLAIEKQFVADGQHSFWAISVTLASEARDSVATGGSKFRTNTEAKIDYKTILSEEAFTRFVRLRELRKKISFEQGIALYNVFTNEQIAAMARENMTTLDELRTIEGVGSGRLDKYGAKFVEELVRLRGATR